MGGEVQLDLRASSHPVMLGPRFHGMGRATPLEPSLQGVGGGNHMATLAGIFFLGYRTKIIWCPVAEKWRRMEGFGVGHWTQ